MNVRLPVTSEYAVENEQVSTCAHEEQDPRDADPRQLDVVESQAFLYEKIIKFVV